MANGPLSSKPAKLSTFDNKNSQLIADCFANVTDTALPYLS